jgi:uncharacterized protein
LQDRAASQLRSAAHELRNPEALVHFANTELQSLYRKEGVPVLLAKSKVDTCLDYFRSAGELGLSEGWFNLGHVLWEGIEGVLEPNEADAMQAFYEAIKLGDCDAMYFVGAQRLARHLHHETDQLQKALLWIDKAAENGHGGALHYLAVFYLNGYPPLDIAPCSGPDFQRRLTAAIDRDEFGDAHYLRGSCYYTGTSGYTKDVRNALNDFLRASELGNSEAAINAGAILHKGEPGIVDADQQRAFDLYQRAGELGNAEGWRNVVACYAAGEGVPQSMETAKYIAETMLKDNE